MVGNFGKVTPKSHVGSSLSKEQLGYLGVLHSFQGQAMSPNAWKFHAIHIKTAGCSSP
jgi:hypothetical protein